MARVTFRFTEEDVRKILLKHITKEYNMEGQSCNVTKYEDDSYEFEFPYQEDKRIVKSNPFEEGDD